MVAARLWSSTVVVSCAVGAALAAPHPLQGPYRDKDRVLATRAPYPEGGVDDVRRPGNNGMLFESRGFIGDPEGKYPRMYRADWGSPGPAAYGAPEDDMSAVFVRVGETTVAINPWEAIPEAGYQRLERGRDAWLKERGFTGGVRTFTNPVFRRETRPETVSAAQSKKLPEPRAVFELPPDMPRFKKRQEVEATPGMSAPAERAPTIVVVRTKDQPAVTPQIGSKERAQVAVKDAKTVAESPKERKVAEAAEGTEIKPGT